MDTVEIQEFQIQALLKWKPSQYLPLEASGW